MLPFVDGVHLKNWTTRSSPMTKIRIYEVTNMPSIMGKFSINYEMTTPKSDNSEGNFVVFIISDLLQITIFSKCFSTLNFPLLQYLMDMFS